MLTMTPCRIEFLSGHLEAMRSAAAAAYPNECCGLLAGSGLEVVTVTLVRQSANLAVNRKTEFAVDPQMQFDLMRELRGTPYHIVGHYHSHPNGILVPSSRDIAGAHDPNAIWIIISVNGNEPAILRAVTIRCGEGEFSEIPIVILP
jgi:proteasome lid subunit RPN8/RPN11